MLVYVLRHFTVTQRDARERHCAQNATQDVARQWCTPMAALLNAVAPEERSGGARFFCEQKSAGLKQSRCKASFPSWTSPVRVRSPALWKSFGWNRYGQLATDGD
jgi:hypothetical protein